MGWAGLLSPAGTPKKIVNKLNAEVVRIIGTSGINDRFIALGAELASSSPDEFGAYIKAEIAKWMKVSETTGMRAQQ